MASRLTVIFYIVLCLEAGVVLTLLPWLHPFGLGDWGENFFLLYASQRTGLGGLQGVVASGWVRGAVTGLGLLNIGMALWELAHFRQTVRTLDAQAGAEAASPRPAAAPPAPDSTADATASLDASDAATADHLPNHGRRDDARDHPAL